MLWHFAFRAFFNLVCIKSENQFKIVVAQAILFIVFESRFEEEFFFLNIMELVPLYSGRKTLLQSGFQKRWTKLPARPRFWIDSRFLYTPDWRTHETRNATTSAVSTWNVLSGFHLHDCSVGTRLPPKHPGRTRTLSDGCNAAGTCRSFSRTRVAIRKRYPLVRVSSFSLF